MAAPRDIEELRRAIVRAVRRVCPGWLAQERDDLAQEVCLRVARKLETTEESTPIGASYLLRAAHSAVMDELRRRRRRPQSQLEPQDDAISVSPSPEDSTGLRAVIDDGLRELPPPRRAAVLLHLYGYSLRESATILGWSSKRVDNQRYQGLAALRSYLKERGFEP